MPLLLLPPLQLDSPCDQAKGPGMHMLAASSSSRQSKQQTPTGLLSKI
jgi:hypothetical protein